MRAFFVWCACACVCIVLCAIKKQIFKPEQTLPSKISRVPTMPLTNQSLKLRQQLALVVELRVEFAVELQQTSDRAKVALVLEEQRLERALGPVVHRVREQLHRDRVHAQKVTDEDHPIDFLIACAHPRNRTDVVRDGNESGIRQIFPRHACPSLHQVHLAKA